MEKQCSTSLRYLQDPSLMDIIHNPKNTQRLDIQIMFSTLVLAYFCLLWVYILCVCCVIDLMPVTWAKYFHYTTQWGFMCERHTWAGGEEMRKMFSLFNLRILPRSFTAALFSHFHRGIYYNTLHNSTQRKGERESESCRQFENQ